MFQFKQILRFNQQTFVIHTEIETHIYICVISATCYLILKLHEMPSKQSNAMQSRKS